MNHERIAILSGLRTPWAKAGGALAGYGADDLGAVVVRELLARSSIDPGRIDELIAGNVAQPADAANVARIIALKAGLPTSLIASTVHRNCASGMEAITVGAAKLLTGEAQMILAVGTESMSRIPLLYGEAMTALFTRLMRAKSAWQRLGVWAGFRPSMLKPIIGVQVGLTDPICGLNMGQTAEVLAREFAISREEQDAFALMSHQRAVAASAVLAEEILPVPLPPRFADVLSHDDGPRAEQTAAALAKLKPYFDKVAGTVTVGNACPLTDGAAAMLLCTESHARAHGLHVLGYLRAWSYAALDGKRMGLGPVHATAKLLDRTGLALANFDRIEINEAFAAQVLACERAFASDDFAQQELRRPSALGVIDRERLNVHGGAIALGHPVGATGMRLCLTVLKELQRKNLRRGLATLCVGGGQGAALCLEAP